MLSIVIPTYRPKFLERTLRALFRQTTQIKYEIIVVENGEQLESTEELCRQLGVRYLFTPTMGANHARNHGVENANFDLIALVDDDIMPYPLWMESIVRLHKEYDFDVAGGRVDLHFLEQPPEWLLGQFQRMLVKINWEDLLTVDPTGPFFLKQKAGQYLATANMSFSRSSWEYVGGFDEELGYIGRELWAANDEPPFLDKCFNRNGVIYDPSMSVRHIIDIDRMDIRWFEKRYFGQGVADFRWHRKKHNLSIDDAWAMFVEKPSFGNYRLTIDEIQDKRVRTEFMKVYYHCKIQYFRGIEYEICNHLQCENRQSPFAFIAKHPPEY